MASRPQQKTEAILQKTFRLEEKTEAILQKTYLHKT